MMMARNYVRQNRRLCRFAVFATFAVLPLAGLAQERDQPTTGTLTGVVVREDTGEPIRDARIAIGKGNAEALALESAAQVALAKNDTEDSGGAVARLLQATANSLAGSDSGREFTAVTDNNGRFRIEGIAPGEYPVTAQRDGFVSTTTTSTPTVSRDTATVVSRKSTEIALKMIPGAAFSGRILDSNGMHAPNAIVEIFRRGDEHGISPLQLIMARSSDDRGEFRVFQLQPGVYFVLVKPASTTSKAIRTYYPNTSEMSEAIPIILRSGDDLAGINIQMRNINGERDSAPRN
jgi:Carboxypeptidase regulatory-like domain